ncbi:MAG: hypothetical protein CMM94_01345 [Rickettsiales bacterium]|nr:hypothetical protein [Rickettsiales bacterium]
MTQNDVSQKNVTIWQSVAVPVAGLFTALGTLVCCALPALFVALGAGAALAGLVSSAPWLVALSQHKVWVFGIAGTLIVAGGLLRWNARYAPCPADPRAAAICTRMRRIGGVVYWASVAIYAVGFFFAFVAVELS